jgi:CheY-like chemotaxis protein
VSLEQFKTQILLLHSQQRTLDTLSAGFSDRYSVHCATSGSEALLTLGDTPIHVIVSAQDLPGMSGLEALLRSASCSPVLMKTTGSKHLSVTRQFSRLFGARSNLQISSTSLNQRTSVRD